MKVKSVRPRPLSAGCLLISTNRTKTATQIPKLRIMALIMVDRRMLSVSRGHAFIGLTVLPADIILD